MAIPRMTIGATTRAMTWLPVKVIGATSNVMSKGATIFWLIGSRPQIIGMSSDATVSSCEMPMVATVRMSRGARAKTTYPATDLARFELDQPFARVTVDDQVFAFGMVNAITNEQYVLTGDTVYLVSPIHGFALPTQADSLASHMLLADDEIPRAFVLSGAKLEIQDGKWVRTPIPADAAKLSQDDYVRWVDSWRYASSLATNLPAGKPSAESLLISLQNGRSIDIRVQTRTPDVRLLRMDENMEYVFSADTGANLLAPGLPVR